MGATGIPPTISFADLYGYRTPGTNSGPNQPSDTEKASGATVAKSKVVVNPSHFWLALVGLIVLIRVLWEKGS